MTSKVASVAKQLGETPETRDRQVTRRAKAVQHRRYPGPSLIGPAEGVWRTTFDQEVGGVDWLAEHLEGCVLSPAEIVAASQHVTVSPPNGRGVYFLLFCDRIHYIGLSNCLHYRITQHLRKVGYSRWACIVSPSVWVTDELERYYLNAYQPTWNNDMRPSRCDASAKFREVAKAKGPWLDYLVNDECSLAPEFLARAEQAAERWNRFREREPDWIEPPSSPLAVNGG